MRTFTIMVNLILATSAFPKAEINTNEKIKTEEIDPVFDYDDPVFDYDEKEEKKVGPAIKSSANKKENLRTLIKENIRAPVFTSVVGSVLEFEPAGTPVMVVGAVDDDISSPSNRVSYRLEEDWGDKFAIDEDTGEITTKVILNRDDQEYYDLTVIAEDGAPSSLLRNGQPNQARLNVRIIIKS